MRKHYSTLQLKFKILEKVNSDVKLIGDVLSENRELRIIMNNPVIDTYKKLKS